MPLRFVWPILAALFGFALGGSYVWGLLGFPQYDLRPAVADQAANSEGQQAHQQKSIFIPDDSTGFYAFCTALFTGALFLSTTLLWKATNRTARIAERALTELEAPIVAVKIINPGISWDLGKRTFTLGTLKYSFVNHGRTAATIHELVDDVRSVNVGEGFPPTIRAERGPQMPYGVFIPPDGETEPFNNNIFAAMLGLAGAPDAFRRVVPFFLGTVRYSDIFGNLYVMGFCFMFDDVGNRFIEAGGPEYSYCRKVRGPYRAAGANRPAPTPPPVPPPPTEPETGDLINPQ
jgi:hypothetical protein